MGVRGQAAFFRTGHIPRWQRRAAEGLFVLGQRIGIESILGSYFSGCVADTTTFGPHAAIIPEVEGTAHITGRHEFLIDPADELRNGFLLR